MEKYFGPNGSLSSIDDNFKFRKEQHSYAESVQKIITNNSVGIVEGGTGVGKTLGYLVPHILSAKEFGSRVMIATKTKNLQDQIFLKDLPKLKKMFDFNYALLKGRENYICRERLEDALEREELFKELPYYKALQALNEFDKTDLTGDIENAWEIIAPFGEDGRKAVNDVRATDDTCTSNHWNKCRHYQSIEKAEKSLVIVVNHHLSLYWPEIYPAVNHVVFDEAHNLEDAATDVFSQVFSTLIIRARLNRLYSKRRRTKCILDEFTINEKAEFEVNKIINIAESIKIELDEFDSATIRTDIYDEFRQRIKDDELDDTVWTLIREKGMRVASMLFELGSELFKLCKNISAVNKFKVTSEKLLRAGTAFDEYSRYAASIFNDKPIQETVLWYEAIMNRPVTYRRSPINTGPLLNEKVYSRYKSVLLTSATMQVSGGFEFIESRLGLIPIKINEEQQIELYNTSSSEDQNSPPPDTQTPVPLFLEPSRRQEPVSVGHPFNYKKSVLLCLVNNDAKQDANIISRQIEEISDITHGRMLVLFTNKSRMLEVRKELVLDGIEVLSQYADGSRHFLAKKLSENPDTVLLGTKSFWEGVDIPGENLSVVVIEKIPFISPGEPLYDARCESLGDNWFREYALPIALLTLRQGFGRLIRKEDDFGIVVILNPGRKNYRSNIIKTLPACELAEGNFESILTKISEWWEKKNNIRTQLSQFSC